jgi:hypothetical protein
MTIPPWWSASRRPSRSAGSAGGRPSTCSATPPRNLRLGRARQDLGRAGLQGCWPHDRLHHQVRRSSSTSAGYLRSRRISGCTPRGKEPSDFSRGTRRTHLQRVEGRLGRDDLSGRCRILGRPERGRSARRQFSSRTTRRAIQTLKLACDLMRLRARSVPSRTPGSSNSSNCSCRRRSVW